MIQAARYDFSDYEEKFKFSINAMARFVKWYKCLPIMRRTALSIVRGVPPRDRAGEAGAIHAFVRDRIDFRPDVNDVETIQTPVETLKVSAGDCDDKVTLQNTLLEAIGFATRFKVFSQDKAGAWTHVASQAHINGQWVTLETVRPVPMGYEPPATRSAVYAY